jgi:hypothetical protein
LTITPRQMTELFEQIQNRTALVLHAGAPTSFEVRFGETVALNQFVNHSTGQKVTEYLTIKDNGHQGLRCSREVSIFCAPGWPTLHPQIPRTRLNFKGSEPSLHTSCAPSSKRSRSGFGQAPDCPKILFKSDFFTLCSRVSALAFPQIQQSEVSMP